MEFCDEFLCEINQRHILKDPKKLPCGTVVCFKCIDKPHLRCPGCKGIHSIENPNSLESDLVFEEMLNDSFKYVNKEAYEKLDKQFKTLHGLKVFSYHYI